MSVNVSFHIKEKVIDPNDLIGGISICVDGNRVNAFEEGSGAFDLYEWRPQYIGEHIFSDFSSLVETTTRLASGEVMIYESIETCFDPLLSYWLFIPLSTDDLLIAYRTQTSYHGEQAPPLPTPESSRGYIADRCDFCRAVSESAHEFVREVESMPLEFGLDLLPCIKESLSNLDKTLETCEQTPTEFPSSQEE